MRSTSEALRRTFALSLAGYRPIVLIALAAPLALSACATSQTGTKTTSLSPSRTAPTVDAYGYAPVRITAFADGSRIALPSQKPDAAKLAAAPAKPAVDKAKASGAAAKEPRNEIAALAEDVAERKAATMTAAPVAVASADVAAKAARSAAVAKPDPKSPLASAAEAVPATIAAVGETVGEAAGTVTTAAVATSAKAYNAVTERFGDTFKGRDTITGDAAIDRMIERAAAENDIPSELAYAVVRVESHYNPKAKGSGVYGLSQIQPATARSLGFSGQTSDLYDPETNLRYGMKYLAGAWQKSGGDICGAAMKYKGGHRTTRMSKSAAVYCANVKRHMAAIERRRAPANRETIVAAAEREKQIAVAKAPETVKALPGVKNAAPIAATAPVIAAAASPSGRSVAASAAPVPASASVAAPLTAVRSEAARGGRVVAKREAPVSAALGLTD